jgi:voltage-gated potassium channel
MNERSTNLERKLEIPMIIAAILTLPALLLEDGSKTGTWHNIGYIGGAATWAVFLAGAILMFSVADSRWHWVRNHPLDIAIVVLTPPVAFSTIQALRLLRVLRLLRLIRIAPIARRVFSPQGLKYVGFLALLVLLISAEAFSSAANISYGNGIYWALSTMTTVGYGDITPHNSIGKVIACIVMVVGIGFFAVLTGAIAQQFLTTQVVELEQDEQDLLRQIRETTRQLQRLEEQVVRQAQSRS